MSAADAQDAPLVLRVAVCCRLRKAAVRHAAWAVLCGWMGILLFNPAWAIDSAPAFEDPGLQARYESLTRQLRCLVCQNEAIADSNASLAADLRRELREQIMAGRSDAEILKFMTDRYGAFVLYKPPFEPRTWLLWSAPVLLLLIALVSAGLVIVRRSRNADAQLPDNENDLT